MSNLTYKILGTTFSSPIWLGSGTISENKERVDRFLKSEVGAIVPRTTRFKYAPGRKFHPSYHLDINMNEKWMRNCEWTGNLINYWQPYLKELSKTKKIIISVSGRDIGDCLKVCKIIDKYNFPFIEINISCAHSNEAHGFITRNSEHISILVKTLKKNIKTPIVLKLGHSDFIVTLAQVAEKSGVDAIVAINTYGPVIDFDINSGKPELTLGINSGKGGLSGKAIFHIALTDVVNLSQNLNIPIIACGGVTKPEDAIKMIMAGASAVQIYSAVHMEGTKGDIFLNKFINDFDDWLNKYGYANINDLRGILLPKLSRPHQMDPIIPEYNKNLCIKCKACINICLENAISLSKNIISINKNKCIGCGACASVCPTKALK
ncbi:MAG: 4Fe-4S binding protein [bacterium]|nr:4Fe-4S binding protein [bacterium]